MVDQANRFFRTNYQKSFHLIGNIFGRGIVVNNYPTRGLDIETVPYSLSFGRIGRPVIYGAIGSEDMLEYVSNLPEVRGAYVRLKEGAGIIGGLVKLWNSVSNTEKLRKNHPV